MISNAEFINQPYAGIYEEKVFDAESNDNSQEWSWVRFTNDDETEWCGQFRGFPIQFAVSEVYHTLLVLTSDHLFQLSTVDGTLEASIENNEYSYLSVCPDGKFVLSNSSTIFLLGNYLQEMTIIESPFKMDLIKFKTWEKDNLFFVCEELGNWGKDHQMKFNHKTQRIENE